jgi:hypothetical protein
MSRQKSRERASISAGVFFMNSRGTLCGAFIPSLLWAGPKWRLNKNVNSFKSNPAGRKHGGRLTRESTLILLQSQLLNQQDPLKSTRTPETMP